MFLTGLLIVATSAQDALLNVLALLFGAGVGLAFDEFARWLDLAPGTGTQSMYGYR